MLSIDDYIDEAKKINGIKSDVGLGREIQLSNSQVAYWRKRKSLPSDETIVKLATLAKMDVDLALLHLSWWRAVSRNEHQAASRYKLMIENYHPIAA